MDKIRVVEYTDHWTAGGIESYITNLVSGLDKDRFDIVVLTSQKETDLYDSRLKSSCDKKDVSVSALMQQVTGNPILRVKRTIPLFQKYLQGNHCDILHLHICQGVVLRYAKIAKQCGVRLVIAHSHNSKFGDGHFLIKWLAHQYGRIAYGKYIDVRLACSDKAAQWLYPKYKLGEVKQVNYVVDVDHFRFSSVDRIAMRKSFGVKDEVVYLTVGRMHYQKNPEFLLRVFQNLADGDSKCRLVWIGTGEYSSVIRRLANEWKLSDRIIFIEKTLEVEKYMSMADVFLLPSWFEGNPIVVTEAQASGMPCYLSDAVTSQAKLLPTTKYIPLSEAPTSWAKIILAGHLATNDERIRAAAVVREGGYNMAKQIYDMERIYCNESY